MPESHLVEHARRELDLLGQTAEDPEFSAALVAAVAAFASYGHSGGSAGMGANMLNRLLRHEPLTPIRVDDAWIDQSEASGIPMWQNARDSRVFCETSAPGTDEASYYRIEDTSRAALVAVEGTLTTPAPPGPDPDMNWLLGSTDAQMWAGAFQQMYRHLAHQGYQDPMVKPIDDTGWLIGWFANALEAGRNAGARPFGGEGQIMCGHAVTRALEEGRKLQVRFLTDGDISWEDCDRATDENPDGIPASFYAETFGQLDLVVRDVTDAPEDDPQATGSVI